MTAIIQTHDGDLPPINRPVRPVHTVTGESDWEAPRPLFRDPTDAEPFPVDDMGPTLAGVTNAIVDLTQAPAGICANSVLAAASLAVQARADIRIPGIERAHPLTLYLLTIAASGERKTTADREALLGVRMRECDLREAAKEESVRHRNAVDAYEAARSDVLKKAKGDYNAARDALDALGEAPKQPTRPIMLMSEPTVEALVKRLADSPPSVGVFSSEGGSFVGGHALSDEAKLRSAARLSSLWDGEAVDRIRAGEPPSVIVGKRVAVHLMAQPEASARFLSDPTLRDQGLLSRFLISAPTPTAGTRLFKNADPRNQQTISDFAERISGLLRSVPVATDSEELPVIVLDDAARELFICWHDEVEKSLRSGGKLAPVKGFASKLAEHAARIAGVIALVEDPSTRTVMAEAMLSGVNLANHYASETLRLADEARVSDQLRIAERLRLWLVERDKRLIHISEIYQFGPSELRDKAAALAAAKILVDHGHLEKLENGVVIDGRARRDAWRFREESLSSPASTA